jgi:hypothetical protein
LPYGWSLLLTVDLLCKLTTKADAEYVLIFILDCMRLSTLLVHFPTHATLFESCIKLEQKWGSVPCAQYIMYPFDQVNYEFFSKKDMKSLAVDPTLKMWKFETIYSVEVREKIIKDTCDMLVH